MKVSRRVRSAGRLLAVLGLSALALQLAFAMRIGVMAFVDPLSTTYQRSQAWGLLDRAQQAAWGQQWVDAPRLSAHLKRAVIAAEDAGFSDHLGVDWDALERAWERNRRAQERSEARSGGAPPGAGQTVKLVGGSTITQQLAKNLLLSGERTVWRKAQEMVLAFMLEAVLDKRRILEIYLNSVEWGEGLFGAEAAARYYFRTSADRLTPMAAARLAVMLPAPKRFERRPDSPFLLGRAATVAARMGDVVLP
jgi:monofunctional glycosyltransferase